MRIVPAAFAFILLAAAQAGMARPARTARPAKPVPPAAHKVRRGETATRIAPAAGLSLEQLAALNPRVDLARLSPGTVLKLKGARQAPEVVRVPEPVRTPEPARTPEAAKVPEPGPAAAPAARTPSVPMSPLPAIRTLAPAILVHLERLIPMSPARR